MRIGHIDFLNCLPLTYTFSSMSKKDFYLSKNVPAELNYAITHDSLDISPVSSIIYARNWENLMILPNVSITADKEVQSIILVSKKPIEKINTDKILLTAQSATSHCLLKIILNKAYHAKPNYEIQKLSPKNIFADDTATAALFIGDDALYVNYHQEKDLYYYDLGNEWYKLTGLCMVYAVWVVRREYAKLEPKRTEKVQKFIVDGFKQGFLDLHKAIDTLCTDKPFTHEQLYEYLHIIKWQLGEKQLRALALFYQYAYELKLIKEIPRIAIFTPKLK